MGTPPKGELLALSRSPATRFWAPRGQMRLCGVSLVPPYPLPPCHGQQYDDSIAFFIFRDFSPVFFGGRQLTKRRAQCKWYSRETPKAWNHMKADKTCLKTFGSCVGTGDRGHSPLWLWISTPVTENKPNRSSTHIIF